MGGGKGREGIGEEDRGWVVGRGREREGADEKRRMFWIYSKTDVDKDRKYQVWLQNLYNYQ